MKEGLKESGYFLWIIEKDEIPTFWMQKEWEWFEEEHEGDFAKKSSPRAIFCPDYTDIADQFKRNSSKKIMEIGDEISSANIECNIKRSECQSGLIRLMKYYEVIRKEHGEIVFPEFCSSSPKIDASEIGEMFEGFAKAIQQGLIKVYPDKNMAMQQIAENFRSLTRNSQMKMLGFTLRRYIDGTENNFRALFKTAIEKKDCRLQILTLNPKCTAAVERMHIESPKEFEKDKSRGSKTVFFKDRKAVVEYCVENGWYMGKGQKNKVEMKTYHTPYIGLVIFDEEIFIEIYHLGNNGERMEQTEERTICGRVPVFVVRRDTPFYKLFNSHFDTVWKNARWETK